MRAYNVGVVVQRYGAEVNGGAEYLARQIAERLAVHCNVHVYTTCAIDHVTWENDYPDQPSWINGVLVERFAVDRRRDMRAFSRLHQLALQHPFDMSIQTQWLVEQGPSCPHLLEALGRDRNRHDVIIFFTYLYYPTVFGLPIASDRSLLVPFAHDEPMIRMPIFMPLFASSCEVMYQTEEERGLVESVFPVAHKSAGVAGCGVEVPTGVGSRNKLRCNQGSRALYVGRIEEGKGCDEMIEFVMRYNALRESKLILTLVGKVNMPIPRDPHIICLGFVDERKKWDLYDESEFLIAPSQFESLSMVLLEAFAVKRPVLVNARCDVLRGHCMRSNGGLYYSDFAEFCFAVDRLAADRALRAALGENGCRYVESNYSWDRVIETYDQAVGRIIRSRTS